MLNYLEKSNGLLGMNARNLLFIRPFNSKEARRIADHKLISKKLLRKNGIPVPVLLGKVKNETELENFDWSKLPKSFVLKPNRGLGGEGIVVIFGRNKRSGNWVKADKQEVTTPDLQMHIRNIFEGSFSLSNQSDKAFFEERVKLSRVLKPYSYRGIPDLRIIVFNRVPVMAMLRLPTELSRGRANLHLGGICCGIDMATGVTTHAITRSLSTQQDYELEFLPGTRLPLAGLRIPYWPEALEIASRCQEVSGLGFLGVDIMIDRDRGPVVAEINVRPGLSIQNANRAALRERLERVRGLKILSAKKAVRLSQDLFGGEIEENVEEMTGKRVVGIFKKIMIEGPRGKRLVDAKLDTGAYYTSIDEELAVELGYGEALSAFKEHFPYYHGSQIFPGMDIDQQFEATRQIREQHLEEIVRRSNGLIKNIKLVFSSNGVSIRPVIETQIILDKTSLTTKATIVRRKHLRYPVIIGRKSLHSFIIDVGKRKEDFV
jgi:alpha-L-glutamate ligase-like protein